MMITEEERQRRVAFGKYVRARRMAAGLSQSKLGELIGWDSSAVCVMENDGKGRFDESDCGIVAEALGIDLDVMLSRAGLIADDTAERVRKAQPFVRALLEACDAASGLDDWQAMRELGHKRGYHAETINHALGVMSDLYRFSCNYVEIDPLAEQRAAGKPKPWPLVEGMPR